MKRLHLCGENQPDRSSSFPLLAAAAREAWRGGVAKRVLRRLAWLACSCLIWWTAGGAESAQAGVWIVNGGTLRVGAVVRADKLTVGAGGCLSGQGRITCDVLVKGVLSPHGDAGGAIASLSFGGKLEFADSAVFVCDVSGTPSETDVLNVDGQVCGLCGIVVNQASGAVPWRNEIVAGGEGSDFGAFSVSPAGSLLCQLQAAGTALMLTDVLSDSDADGLPDYWEHDYFGHPTAADAGADPDGDTLNNLEECLAGTEPKNGDSCLRWVQIVPLAGGDVSLTWDSVSGRFYTLARSKGDFAAFTPLITGIPAAPPQNTVTVRTDSAGQSFYRIILE